MRVNRWAALAALALTTSCVVQTGLAAVVPDGRLGLVIENCLPAQPGPRQAEHGQRRPHYDLHVDLTVAGGKVEPKGWAWFSLMPAAEHEVTVTRGGEISAKGEFEVTLQVAIAHQLPTFTGGTGEITIKGNISNNLVSGTYAASFTGLDQKEAAALWSQVAVPKTVPVAIKGGLRTGKTASITNLARRGTSDEAPEPIAVKGELMERPAAKLAVANAAQQKKVLASESGAKGLETLKAVMAEASEAEKAVGAAVLAIYGGGEKVAATEALAAASRGSLERPADLAAVALAAMLLKDDLAADAKGSVATVLAERAEALTRAEVNQLTKEKLAEAEAMLPEGPGDYRFAQRRGAAGLAALAAQQLKGADERTQRALAIAARSVERFLKRGVGTRGSGNGNNGFDEAMETVVPFAIALRQQTGEDLGRGTGLAWVSTWAAYTRGLVFNPQQGAASRKSWLVAAGLPLAMDGQKPALAWYLKQAGLDAESPLQATLALMHWPDVSTAKELKGIMPTVLADGGVNAYAMRSGWDDTKDFVTVFEMGSANEKASAMRGHFSVYGFGREWILRTPAKRGEFSWPNTRELNLLQTLSSETTARGEVVNVGGSSMAQVRARRDGTATSIAMRTGGFFGAVGQNEEDVIDESKSWRVMGVDYTKASGAAALVTIVEGTFMLDDRHQVFELNVGPVPAANVKIDGLSFTLTAPNTPPTQSMTGHFLYPTTTFIEYVPPTKDMPHGRIRAHRQKPGEKSLQAMMKKLDERLDAKIDAMLKDQDSNIDVRQFDLKLEDANTAQQEQLQRQNEIVYLKMLRETSSVKMGAPDRRPRAKASWVAVLTIQDGAAPAVKLLDTSADGLCTVGGQTVTYRENLIEFAK